MISADKMKAAFLKDFYLMLYEYLIAAISASASPSPSQKAWHINFKL